MKPRQPFTVPSGFSISVTGTVWYWRGPAPHHFVTVPEVQSAEIKEVVSSVTYGWGMVPVTAVIGNTEWRTSLWPKDGLYILPVKADVRRAEHVQESDTVTADRSPVN